MTHVSRLLTRGPLVAATIAGVLAGCASTGTINPSSTINTIVQNLTNLGKVAVTIGGYAVQVECSKIPSLATTASGTIISVVAPDSKTGAAVQTYLADNANIAAALCPLYTAIVTQVPAPTASGMRVVGVVRRHHRH